LKKGQIHILQSAKYISEIGKSINIENLTLQYPDTPKDLLDRRIVITPPKTKKSNRTINVSPSVMRLLEQWQYEQKVQKLRPANKWKNSDWVFTDTFGDILNPNLPSKWLHKLLADNNLPELKSHGLRHSCASLLLTQGQDIAAISKRLGHSNTNTTTRIYMHSSDTQD
jgi:integrase